jgi:hypothetical protein
MDGPFLEICRIQGVYFRRCDLLEVQGALKKTELVLTAALPIVTSCDIEPCKNVFVHRAAVPYTLNYVKYNFLSIFIPFASNICE